VNGLPLLVPTEQVCLGVTNGEPGTAVSEPSSLIRID
jgi:hypothetical protein